ncbi:MAG: hypothetical protein ACLGGX_07660 [Bdellovibrionia bacterium]
MIKKTLVSIAFSIPLLALPALADNPAWSKHQFIFDLEMDMNLLYEVTHTKPEQLIDIMKRSGRDILLIKDSDDKKAKNPLYKNLNYASDDLLKKAEIQPSYSGRLIPTTNPCCDLTKDTVLIKDTAPTYTLIHEYMHSLLEFKGTKPQADIEKTYSRVERKQLFYQRKLLENPVALLTPLWRKDMLSTQQEIIDMMYQRIRLGQAQEAIIEKLLSRYIDKNSPYFDEARSKEGLKYAEAMINNAITVYNNLHFSITWNMNTVIDLRSGLDSKELVPVEKSESLTKDEADEFIAASKKQLEQLKRTENEIIKMKSFFTK